MSLQLDRSPSRSSHDSARATIVQPEPVPEKDDSERDYEKRDDADEQVASEESDDRQTAEPAAGVDDYPEGGLKAWLVVLGAACVTCATFGFINSWGVFQSIYEENLLRDVEPSTIAWIGSIQYSLVFFPGLLTGRMFDLGWYRIPQLFWSIVLVVAVFLVAECTKYWHFVLVQGIMLGLASGCLFGPVMAVLTHWFKKRRSLAFGIVAVGSAVGGTVFPIAARRLKDEIGFAWSLRVMGFMILMLLGIANLTLHRRLPPVHVSGGLFNFAAFKSVAFSSYCASSFFAFFGIYAVLTYLDVGAISHGVSPEFSFYLISIANASSAVGRLASGVMGDRIGAVNTLIPCTLFAAIMTYIWPYAHTQSSLIAVAVLYGFASGTYVSLLVVPIAHMGDHGDVGRRTGMANTILAIGALAGPPTSGAIATATGSYNALGAFAGSMVVLSCLCMLVTKWAMTGHLLRGKF
ncbi:MFS general substrate transporter [Exidia glandulosa HHB12029]|uniref:MFS general substrate transporter n=1 Tax=Exidia glandulosa HHB12029 TaxID=1314781 RepID=A0A165C9H3_EXIGL|nr:MFS general substrate transporter [Exidia glandulosa HHB12029]